MTDTLHVAAHSLVRHISVDGEPTLPIHFIHHCVDRERARRELPFVRLLSPSQPDPQP